MREALRRLGAVVRHLLDVPAGSDPEQEPSAGEHIDRGDLLGGDDRVALDDQADPGGDLQPLGGDCGSAQRYERVERAAVLRGQLSAGGIRGATTRRDMGVLREEQRLKTALLRHPSELVGPCASSLGKIPTPNSMFVHPTSSVRTLTSVSWIQTPTHRPRPSSPTSSGGSDSRPSSTRCCDGTEPSVRSPASTST